MGLLQINEELPPSARYIAYLLQEEGSCSLQEILEST